MCVCMCVGGLLGLGNVSSWGGSQFPGIPDSSMPPGAGVGPVGICSRGRRSGANGRGAWAWAWALASKSIGPRALRPA